MNNRRRRLLLPILIAWIPVSLEVWVRYLDLDNDLVVGTLYFQESNLAVQRVSTDPVLHYEHAPGTSLEARSRWGGTYKARINAQGARGSTRSTEQASNLFRVLFFGASTVYGVEVDDEETLPARLEAHLQQRFPGGPGIEVWNFGTPAYVPSQIARLASQKIASIPGVDLVILMPTNQGRRAFLGGPGKLNRDYSAFFENDPLLWAENFPSPSWLPQGAHVWALRHLATYRWAFVSLTHESLRHTSTNDTTRQLSAREMRALESLAESKGIQIFHSGYPPLPLETDLLRALSDLPESERKTRLEDRHPSPDILDLHARSLAAQLQQAGLLPEPENKLLPR